MTPRFQLIDRKPCADNWNETIQIFERFAFIDSSAVDAEIPDEGMPYLRFDESAQEVYSRWLVNHENRLRNEDMPECLESHFGKYQSLAPSIALILHIAEGNSGPVGITSIGKAIAWTEYLERHARRIYAPIVGADFVAARALAKKIKSKKLGDCFSLRDVYRNGWANLSKDEVILAADVLVDFNWIERSEKKTHGRTATIYRISPLVWETEL